MFGINPWRFGTHAEYVRVPAAGPVAPKPAALPFEDAAAVCDGGLVALMNLPDAQLGAAQHVAIYGASGSIGTAAVQLARTLHATVTAVTSTANVDLVRGLGLVEAHHYVDTGQKRGNVVIEVNAHYTPGRYTRCTTPLV